MPGDKRSISVLLVDDQKFVGVAVGRLLASESDVQLHCCHNALEAVDRANQIRPDVILQDLVMPDIDGLTMVQLFRANPATAATPIIVLSGNDDVETRSRANTAGANDYLVKLPPRHELVGCIRRHAAGAGAVRPSESPAPADEPAFARKTAETLDRRVMARFRQTDSPPDFIPELIDHFIEEAGKDMERLRDAGLRMDAHALTSSSHSLKGSSLTVGANKLATLCGQMETHAQGDLLMRFTLDLMAELDQELVKVRHALETERQDGRQ